jgi:4-amino-4-deoxy-L-arabinose transferase-like glycosyltransferase
LTSIRIVSALVGLIAVGTTFLAARALLRPEENGFEESGFLEGWPTLVGPLLAAFFMAILFPLVHFSRLGVRAILFVPLETLVVYFLWRGIQRVENIEASVGSIQVEDVIPLLFRSIRIGWFAAAGVFLGLGLYTFAAARFMPLLIVAFFFIWWLQDRRVFNRYFVNIFILTAASIIAAGPLLLFFLRQPYYLVYRSRFIANRGVGTFPGRPWITWALNIGRVVRGLFWQGDQNIVNNLPGRPFLDPIQSLLAFLGAISIVRWRPRIRDQFLIIWLLVMLLPGILSGDAPHFGRLLGAAAPLALIISKGCIWLVQTIGNINISWGSTLRKGAIFGLISLLLLSLGLTVFDYFSRYQGDSELRAGFDNDDWQLGLAAAALPEEAAVYLSPTQEEMATILYAFGGQEDRLRSFFSPLNSLIPVGVPGKPAYYLVRSPANFVNDQINHYFPESHTDSRHSDYDVLVIP